MKSKEFNVEFDEDEVTRMTKFSNILTRDYQSDVSEREVRGRPES
jgi:hypothetical protein